MNQTETIDYKHGTTYAITVTALMTAVTVFLHHYLSRLGRYRFH